jgi:hypothetical protein
MKTPVIKDLTKSQIRASAIKEMEYRGHSIWIQNNLAVKGRKFIGRRGQADCVGFTKYGQFLAVEIKTINDRLSSDQITFLNDVKKAGGEAYIACQEGNQVVLREWVI